MALSDYFSIEAILCQEEKVPITFKVDVHKLGYLDPGSADEDIHAGSRIEVPLWLARTLCSRNIADISWPKGYTQRFLSNLKADPSVVSLGTVAPFFYDVAMELAKFWPEDDGEAQKLLETLQSAKVARYRYILDKCQNMRNADLHEVTRRLTFAEKKLFDVGYVATTEFEAWKNRRTDQLTKSSILLSNSRKRKAIESHQMNTNIQQQVVN